MKQILISCAIVLTLLTAASAQTSQPTRPRKVATLPGTPCSPRDFVQAVDTGNTSICRANGLAWDAAAGPTASGAAAGSNTQVQINNAGALAGDATLTYGPGEFDASIKRLAIGTTASFGNTAQLRVVNPSVVLGASPSHFSSVRSDFTIKATVATNQLGRGFYGYFSTDPTNTVNFGGIVGAQAVSDGYGTGVHTVIVGTFGEADNSSSVTQPKTVGAWGYSGLYGSGDTTLGIGGEFGAENYGAGTVVTGIGVRIGKPQENGGTGAITNVVGLLIDEQLTGTTTSFNLISKGATSKNKFEGDVNLDKLTASTLLGLSSGKDITNITLSSGLTLSSGTVLVNRLVSAKTTGYTVLDTDASTFFTNTGASGSVTFTMPTPVVGMSYEFYRDANQTVTVDIGGSVTIRVGASVTTAGGNITLDAVGSRIRLVAISTTQWVGDASGAVTFN